MFHSWWEEVGLGHGNETEDCVELVPVGWYVSTFFDDCSIIQSFE